MTTGAVARAAEVSEQIIRLYADNGLLPCERTANGIRLFGSDAPEMARKVYRDRMMRRGQRAK